MNFSELSKSKNIILSALLQMKDLQPRKIKFMIHLFSLFLGIKGKLNFLQFERFGKYDEQTFRNHFRKDFDFFKMNKILVKEHASNNLAIAFDPSYIQKSGRGRPQKYGGKINFKDLDLSKIKNVSKKENEAIFTELVYSKALKINLVIVKTKNKDKWTHKLYFSTDLKMNWESILELYKSRFQIEFLYRDGKQFTGLDDCEARSEEKLNFHFNASLTTVNLAKITHWICVPKEERGAFSMMDVKTVYHNDLLLNRFICKFGINPNSAKNKLKIRQLSWFGRIAA